jgi:arylsulfatase A-like enzyme
MPGKTKPSLRIKEPVLSTDLYPTILDLLDLPLIPEQHRDGKSLKPLLSGKNKKIEREALYFHFPHYHHINSMGPSGAIRMGKYKLIEVFESGKTELYNLESDPGELHDLSKERQSIAGKMLEKLKSWQNKSGVDMATPNPNYIQEKDYRKKYP